jgi:hypothetical protein
MEGRDEFIGRTVTNQELVYHFIGSQVSCYEELACRHVQLSL